MLSKDLFQLLTVASRPSANSVLLTSPLNSHLTLSFCLFHSTSFLFLTQVKFILSCLYLLFLLLGIVLALELTLLCSLYILVKTSWTCYLKRTSNLLSGCISLFYLVAAWSYIVHTFLPGSLIIYHLSFHLNVSSCWEEFALFTIAFPIPKTAPGI